MSGLTPRQRALSFAAVLGCVFATTMSIGLTLPLLSLLMERQGVSSATIGLNVAAGSVALILFTPLVPAVSRALGMYRFLLICFATAPVMMLAFPATNDVWAWFPIRFVLNLALLGLFLISEVWINRLADDRIRGRMTAAYAAVATLGFALGPVILASVGTTGWLPFIVAAAAISFAFIPLLLARDLVPSADDAGGGHVFAYILVAPMATLAAFVHGAAEQSISSFLPVYAVRDGWLEADAALLLTAFGVGNVICQIAIGWLSDKLDRQIVLAGCGVVTTACALLLPPLIGDAVPLYVMVFLWGGAVSALYSVGLALLGQRFHGGDLPPANAAFALLYAVGSLVGPLAAGAAMEPGVFGNDGLAWVVASFAAAYLLVAIMRRIQHAKA